MAYASWSVVFGEQPSAAKWNILGTNDASFNDGTGIFGLKKDLLTTDSNPYKFRASRNSAANTGNGAFAAIAFDTEQFDTNNNLSAGVYTAPVNGFYNFSWRSGTVTSGTETFITSLFKGGVETVRGGLVIATTLTVSSVGNSGPLQLTAGDTVDIRAFNTATRALTVGDIYSTWFSGYLISRT